MKPHFNVQISIQQVNPLTEMAINPDRSIVNLLDLSVVADSEEEAYGKVVRLLEANRPLATTSKP